MVNKVTNPFWLVKLRLSKYLGGGVEERKVNAALTQNKQNNA